MTSLANMLFQVKRKGAGKQDRACRTESHRSLPRRGFRGIFFWAHVGGGKGQTCERLMMGKGGELTNRFATDMSGGGGLCKIHDEVVSICLLFDLPPASERTHKNENFALLFVRQQLANPKLKNSTCAASSINCVNTLQPKLVVFFGCSSFVRARGLVVF